jgi:tetratricopeptide (TPR) repeat protein
MNMEPARPAQPVTPDFFFRPGVMEILVCALTALIYVATLSFGFVYDDIPQILKNPAVHEWRFVPQYFTSHVWAAIYPSSSGNYYRPLFLLWLKANYALFGNNAWGWHLTSVLCHVLATWLVFRMAEKLSGDRLPAFLTALFFGVHPSHIENVAWISGVTDPLMACFLLGSLYAFLNSQEHRGNSARAGRLRNVALSVGLFAGALLVKETAVVLPVLIMAFIVIFNGDFEADDDGGRRESTLGAAIRAAIPYVVVVLIYGFVRFRALGRWSHPTVAVPWREVFLTWPAVLWFYIRHLLLPFRLSEFYSLDYARQASAQAFWLPLALVLTSAIAVWLMLLALTRGRARQVTRFALVLIVVPLLPVLDLRSLTAGDIVHDRYVYLPSVGFALLLAILIRELGRGLSERPRIIWQAALSAFIVVNFAALTVGQQMQWANDILLYTRGMESAPDNLTVRDNLANALLEMNQPARAIPLYLEVLGRNPSFWRSNYNLGVAFYKIGSYQGAEEYLKRAISVEPSDSDQYFYLALTELRLKRLHEATDNAQRALARDPHARGYHFALGLIEEAGGDRTAAATEFTTEIAEHPENAAAAAELKKLKDSGQVP